MKINEINQAVKPTVRKFLDSVEIAALFFVGFIIGSYFDHELTSWDFIVATGAALFSIAFIIAIRWGLYILTK
jgi:hypothetical protein